LTGWRKENKTAAAIAKRVRNVAISAVEISDSHARHYAARGIIRAAARENFFFQFRASRRCREFHLRQSRRGTSAKRSRRELRADPAEHRQHVYLS